MNSFFKSFRALLASVILVAGLGVAASVSAQCVSGCLPETPSVPDMGLTVQGWTQSGAVGVGETSGLGKVVTGEVMTMTDELFKLSADTFLTGNANPDCGIDCKDSQSKLSITGYSKVGAASVGFASTDGSTACGTTSCVPKASSISTTGTNAMFKSSLYQQWQGTVMPVTAPAQ